ICLSIASRLGIPADSQPNPLDFFLNTYLPLTKPVLRGARPLTEAQTHLVSFWPTLCLIMQEIDVICHPDEDFPLVALQPSGSSLLSWYGADVVT
ncbi:MAG: hypothetical protein EXX96DRAFT_578855, partial [Benjaminiella poitrasii]